MKGTVIKRGKRWSVVIDAGRDADGKRVRKWHSGYATKREAEAARVEILSRMAQGAYVAPSKMTVKEWLESWLEGRQGLAETTRAAYEADIRRLVKGLGSRRLHDLNPTVISGFYTELARTLSPKTVKNTHGTLHKALTDALRQGVISRNPADHVELPRPEPPDTETWTADELRAFLKRAESHRLYAAWVLVSTTGMRRSEVLGLRWPNVDLEDGKLAVVDTLVPVRGKPVLRLGETKSRRSRRVIALDEWTVDVLRGHKARQNEERLQASTAWQDHQLVFCNQLGEPVKPDTFTRTTKRLATEAGVPPLTPHPAARHTWATLALGEGIPAKVVQERLGHTSISITMDRYSHLIDGMDRDAAERIAALIR